MVKRNRIRILVGLLAIAVVSVLVWFWFDHHGTGANGRLVLYGNVDIRQVQLAFNDSERITELLVKEGDRVQAGQELAILDSRRFAATVATSEANVVAQQQAVLKAEADMNVAQANLVNADLTFKRVQNLREKKVVSPQDLDNARAAFDVAAAR
jgi:multidrug resistance efflux pump